MQLPPDHPLRVELNDEAHARPPEALAAPLRITFLALYSDARQREQEWEHVCALARRYGHTPPVRASHYSADLGPFRVKWERHTEFTRYKFIAAGGGDPFDPPALHAVPADWLARCRARSWSARTQPCCPQPPGSRTTRCFPPGTSAAMR